MCSTVHTSLLSIVMYFLIYKPGHTVELSDFLQTIHLILSQYTKLHSQFFCL